MDNIFKKIKFLPVFPLAIVIILSLLSLLILRSINLEDFANRYYSKQLIRILIGILAFFAGFLIDASFWKKRAYAFFVICLAMLASVSIVGKIFMGAQRWINLYFFNFQPSELTRLSLVLALAKYFSCVTREETQKNSALIIPIAMVSIPVALVLIQPDFGTAMLELFVGGSIFFICGVQPWKFLAALGCMGIAAPIWWSLAREYQRNRILMFLFPESDINGVGYHIIQSKITLGSGGFLGNGLKQGTQCQLNFLPESQTDFIFAAVGEKMGFLGSLILISLYAALLVYSLNVALTAKDKFNKITSFGIASTLFFYVFINVSMVCGLVPVVGIPLPFFSYGGSSLVVLMFSQGVLSSIKALKELKSKFA